MDDFLHNSESVFHNIANTASNSEVIEDTETLAMRSLWRSVITQALMDAANNSKKKQDRINKIKAIEWLKGDSEDFIEICHLAQLDPAYVRQQAKTALLRGCKWRNDMRARTPITLEQCNQIM